MDEKTEQQTALAVYRPPWLHLLDERSAKHVQWALMYRHFRHGATGQIDMTTIAALADIIDGLVAVQEISGE